VVAFTGAGISTESGTSDDCIQLKPGNGRDNNSRAKPPATPGRIAKAML